MRLVLIIGTATAVWVTRASPLLVRRASGPAGEAGQVGPPHSPLAVGGLLSWPLFLFSLFLCFGNPWLSNLTDFHRVGRSRRKPALTLRQPEQG